MSEVLRKDQSYKGFETWWNAVRMHMKMSLYIGVAILVAQVVITLILSYFKYGEAWGIVFQYVFYNLRSFSMPDIDKLGGAIGSLLRSSLLMFLMSFSLWFLYPAIHRKFKHRAKEQSKDRHLRGAELLTAKELNKQIKEDGEKVHIHIGDVHMPVSAEPKHLFCVGRPGTGKTVAMRGIIEDIRERNNKAVIYDFKGDYLCKFFDPDRDIIFNPLDTRCTGWNLFNEIETFMDIDSIATSLIPPAVANTDPFWNDAARDVYAGLLHYLYQNNLKTNANIWNAVTARAADINVWLEHTMGGERGFRYIEDASSKQAMCVLAVLMQYTKSFEYFQKTAGEFSIKKWLYDDKGGFIFITSYADIEATLRPILSLFVDLLGRKLLSMPDDYNRRIFFIIDEFGTLQRLSTIVKLLTLGRSKGGCVFKGIQDIGQIDQIYTHALRQAIVNACGSNLILSVADPETAKFLSDKIGEREYIETEETHSMGVQDNRDGISLIRRKKTDKLILPSEIQNLKDLQGFVKFPGYHLSHVSLKYKSYQDVAPSFICRPDLNLDAIMAEQAAIIENAERLTANVGRKMESQRKADKDKGERDRNDDDREIEADILDL
ncbi:MAG: type IV secretion system DNA-binding domain-containing protein [Nitrospirota bacterium]